MKATLIGFIIFFFCFETYSQTIKVIQIFNGEVTVQGAKKPLSSGSLISKGDKLIYKPLPGKKCIISCSLNGEGIYRISKDEDFRSSISSNSSFLALIKKFMIPDFSHVVLGHRSGQRLEDLQRVQDFFARFEDNSNALLVLDSLDLKLNYKYFSDTAGRYFFLKYIDRQEQTQNKVVPFVPVANDPGSVLLRFSNREVYGNLKEGSEGTLFELFYANGLNETAFPVSRFYMHIMDLKSILAELKLIRTNAKKGQKDGQSYFETDLLNYLNTFYGRIDIQGIRSQFSSGFLNK